MSLSVSIDVVIAAAGRGARLGAARPKAFVDIAGAPMVRRGMELARAVGARRTVVTVPRAEPEAWIDAARALSPGGHVDAIAGGATRQDSVRIGLQHLAAREAGPEVVLVHDAARPCGSVALWRRVAAAAARHGGAVPVLASVDSLNETGAAGRLGAAVDRRGIVRVQTPQGFRFPELLDAHLAARANGVVVTDDAGVFAAAGRRVMTVAGEEDNFKITDAEDLARARRMLHAAAAPAVLRVGHGYDTHPLVAGRRLILGGVEIDHHSGLDGHSDADALAHAIIDALLGAAGRGDIGAKFPAADERWKDADSLALLAAVVTDDVAAAGFRPLNIDATIVAEQPLLLPHLGTMRERLAATLGIAPECVNIKATRGEGMGPVGRGEGIAAHAVATLGGR